ncbi:VOC family protein [Sodalis endosymbiont of Spalangia cameroni]|uniref:VOC family protein n=1 Tax=Sodalis praecaptivus TaxID=1239307 RepID=UPI0031F88EF0
MDALTLSLDHVGLAVKDLAKAKDAYQKLGFTLTALSMHAGASEADGKIVPWGSGNHCAMFAQGYFEIIGLMDADMPSNVKKMVKRYEGLHIVAMQCSRADDAYPLLVDAGVAALKPMALERDAPFGVNNDLVRRARFRNIYLDTDIYREARFIVIEHGTPEVLWQPHLLTHPNGAEALSGVYFATATLADTIARFTKLAGEPRRQGPAWEFTLATGKLWVMAEEEMRRYSPVLQPHPLHRVAAACIKVKSLASLEAYFQRQEVPYTLADDLDGVTKTLWVGPDVSSHAALQFKE